MRQKIEDLVLSKKTPILGICVGMQILAKKSEEGELTGLGFIDGEVRKFKSPKTKKTFITPSRLE